MRRPFFCPAILAGLPVALGASWMPLQLRAATATAAVSEVRVLLLETAQAKVAPLRGRLQLRDGANRLRVSLPTAQGLTLVAGGSLGGIALEGLPAGTVPSLAIGRELWLETAPDPPGQGIAAADAVDGALVLQTRPYRGRLQVLLDSGRLRIINHLDLEDYLASVVGSEMPASWPQQALRAQAVAARTYALKQRRPAEPFDLRATVASQVYRGMDAETPSTREAVQATRSQVLTYGGELIQAVFHSSSGSATEDSGAVWSRQLPYLVSVPDFDRSSPVSEWTLRFTPSQMRRLFPETGGVDRFEVLSLSATGRLRQVRVAGPLGQRLYSGSDLRKILGLRSTLVRFEPLVQGREDAATRLGAVVAPAKASGSTASMPLASAAAGVQGGAVAPPPLPPLVASMAPQGGPPLRPPSGWLLKGRGFGHGVGMSQWGAYGLASQGMDYARILQHYYRGTSLITLERPAQAAVTTPLAASLLASSPLAATPLTASPLQEMASGSVVSAGRP